VTTTLGGEGAYRVGTQGIRAPFFVEADGFSLKLKDLELVDLVDQIGQAIGDVVV